MLPLVGSHTRSSVLSEVMSTPPVTARGGSVIRYGAGGLAKSPTGWPLAVMRRTASAPPVAASRLVTYTSPGVSAGKTSSALPPISTRTTVSYGGSR